MGDECLHVVLDRSLEVLVELCKLPTYNDNAESIISYTHHIKTRYQVI